MLMRWKKNMMVVENIKSSLARKVLALSLSINLENDKIFSFSKA
jgi:hypothetical protein